MSLKRLITLLLLTSGFLANSMPAKTQETITVRAGTRVIDYFPLSERFLYGDFAPGKVVFKGGTVTSARLNYNILYGDIQFIQNRDTFSIGNPGDIRYVNVKTDTFYFDKGYMRILAGNNAAKFAVRQFVRVVDYQKKGAYGTSSSTAAIDSYSSLLSGPHNYNLIVDVDLVMRKETLYYIYRTGLGFEPFRKKTIFQVFPEKADELKKYLKEQPVDFDVKEDLLRLFQFLTGEQSGK
jgi:hypothetical protein